MGFHCLAYFFFLILLSLILFLIDKWLGLQCINVSI